MNLRLRPTCATLFLLLGACTAATDYPVPTREGASAATCANGVDDDLDGRVDCLDPDCDGRCDELGDRCADGRDNDGDGRLDGLDPGCWTETSLQVTRCAGVDGTAATLVSGATFGWRGSADRVSQAGRTYFGASTAPARIAWATPLTGRLEGSTFDLTVRLPSAVPSAVWLIPASAIDADLTVAPDTERVGMDLGPTGVRVFANILAGAYANPWLSGTEIRLRVTFQATKVALAVRVDDVDADPPILIETPAQWGPDEPVVVLFEAAPSPVPVLLRDVVVRRPVRTRCDRPVPELFAEGENALLDASPDASGGVCVLASIEPTSSAHRRMRAYSGHDNSWTDAGVIDTPGVVLGASLAWDERRGEWFGLVAGVPGAVTLDPSPDYLRTLRGPDCAHLVVGEESGFPRTGLGAGGPDYAVLADGRHRATFDYYGETANRYGLREGYSPDGSPGSWAQVTNLDLGDEYDALRGRSDRLSIDTLGEHRLVFFEAGGEVRLFRELPSGWVSWDAPVFAVDNEPGTFDASRISPPRLVMDDLVGADGRWRGRLWYSGASGSGCATCGRAGSADVEILP